MKRLGLIAIFVSACSFSPSQFRCADSDEARENFECRNGVWTELNPSSSDGGQTDLVDTIIPTVDMSPDLDEVVCGDGLLQGEEKCDGAILNYTCESLNFESGDLVCNDCNIDTSACVPKSTCGNKMIDQGEDCEVDTNLEGGCEKVAGYSGGILTCSEACIFDTSQCNTCGNKMIDNGEACDTEAFGANTCSSILGYEAQGDLSCDNCVQIQSDNCKPVFTEISAGFGHTCALKSDGNIVCWGDNNKNQTNAPLNRKFKSVAAGDEFSCGILESQEIVCWGSNENSRRTPPSGTFLQITLGDRYGCGLSTTNEIKCWGGVNDSRTDGLSGTFQSISAWERHGCALNGDEVSCWGRNDDSEATVPTNTFKNVQVGHKFTCAIETNDELECWGRNDDAVTEPPAGTFSALASGSYHACAIESATNFATCWGFPGDERTAPPRPLEPYRSITAGRQHSCAITIDGNAQCWGKNDNGESSPPAP